MIERIELSRGEILALRRFRSDNDGRLIKGVLERLLKVARVDNEENEANDLHRARVNGVKDILAILYEAELVTGGEND